MDWSSIPTAINSTTTGSNVGSWLYRVANAPQFESSILRTIGPGYIAIVGNYNKELERDYDLVRRKQSFQTRQVNVQAALADFFIHNSNPASFAASSLRNSSFNLRSEPHVPELPTHSTGISSSRTNRHSESFVMLDDTQWNSFSDSPVGGEFLEVAPSISVTSNPEIPISRRPPISSLPGPSSFTLSADPIPVPRSFHPFKLMSDKHRPSPPDQWCDLAHEGSHAILSSSFTTQHSSHSLPSDQSFDTSIHMPFATDDADMSSSQVIVDSIPNYLGTGDETWTMEENREGFTMASPVDDYTAGHLKPNSISLTMMAGSKLGDDEVLSGMVQSIIDGESEDIDFDTTSDALVQKEIIAQWEAFPWFTYRTGLDHELFRSDTGWGCMHRTIQMMVARGFFTCAFGTKHRSYCFNSSENSKQMYLAIMDMFRDDAITHGSESRIRGGCFSIAQICRAGASQNVNCGSRFSPTVAARVVQQLNEERRAVEGLRVTGRQPSMSHIRNVLRKSPLGKAADLLVHVAGNGTVSLAELLHLAEYAQADKDPHSLSSLSPFRQHDKENSGWRPLLLLIPIRLGIHEIHAVYVPNLLDLFTWPCFIGSSGGKHDVSYYFIGTWTRPPTPKPTTFHQSATNIPHDRLENPVSLSGTSEALIDATKFLYLDPHLPQPVPARSTQVPDPLLHSHTIRGLALSKMDPCMVLGFVLRGRSDYDEFIDRVARWSTAPLFSVDTCDFPASLDPHHNPLNASLASMSDDGDEWLASVHMGGNKSLDLVDQLLPTSAHMRSV